MSFGPVVAHKNLIVDDADACVAPQPASPAQMEPPTAMCFPAGIFIVVPALMVNFAPSATVTLSIRL